MTLVRREFLRLAAASAVAPSLSPIAWAQGYPTRAVRIIVGFPPGGAADITARLIGQWLSERLGQPFVIENRPGGGTNIATEAVIKAAPDGYTLLMTGTSNAINATLYKNLNFDFIRDIVAVAGMTRGTLVMEANLSFPRKLFRSSLATPRPIRARSTWRQAATGRPPMWLASCSR